MDVTTLDQLQIVLDPVGQTGIVVALMLVMFSVALGLSGRDFYLLRDKPLLFAGGVVTQIIGLPLLTFLIINVVELPASIAPCRCWLRIRLTILAWSIAAESRLGSERTSISLITTSLH